MQPQRLRVFVVYPGDAPILGFDRSSFPENTFESQPARARSLETLRSHAAYLGRLRGKRGELYHHGDMRSAGLRTAAGPRLSTWV